jgi:hypothetical protein
MGQTVKLLRIYLYACSFSAFRYSLIPMCGIICTNVNFKINYKFRCRKMSKRKQLQKMEVEMNWGDGITGSIYISLVIFRESELNWIDSIAINLTYALL